ncbi:MAG: pyrroline-5-carboxylate reductase [Desulfobacterales bacterium]|nr:pyrroline-5-carboxylate reductase [Desulfobacterales bacterium]
MAYQTIGFIGAGNMAEAMVGAIIHSGLFMPKDIYLSDVNEQRLDYTKQRFSVNVTPQNDAVFTHSDIVILAVKPQVMSDVLSTLRVFEHTWHGKKLMVSIAAGILIKSIEQIVYAGLSRVDQKRLPIIRVMPNTPAMVMSGVSGVCANQYAQDEDVQMLNRLLACMGKVIQCSEEQIHAITAISGSGPAYTFYFIESMIEAAKQLGFSNEEAPEIVLATCQGAIELLKKTNESPETLRKNVTSKGGTTEAAISVMQTKQIKSVIIEAIFSAHSRSKELSQIFKEQMKIK